MTRKKRSEFVALEHPDQDNDKLKSLGVSLCAVLDTTKERKDGTYAIRMRITSNRIPRMVALGATATEEEWKEITSLGAKGRPRKLQRICLDQLLKANDILITMGGYEPKEFYSKFKGVQTDRSNVWDMFDTKIQSLEEEGRIGYANSYRDAKRSFSKFMEAKPRHKIRQFPQLTTDWLKAFETWAKTETKKKRALSRSSIGIYCRNLKVLVNEAIKAGEMTKNPFHEYKVPTSENIKRALSREEVASIMDYSSDNEFRNWYRDLFIFSYLACGMNFSDILRLTWGQIKTYPSADGQRREYIQFVRKKTERKQNQSFRSIVILKRMQDIIDRWGSSRGNDSAYIFKVLNRAENEPDVVRIIKQEVRAANRHLKEIARELEIDEGISTYSARHSWATHAAHAGQNIYFIQSQLGHSDYKTTEAYLKSLGPGLVEKSMSFVVGFE